MGHRHFAAAVAAAIVGLAEVSGAAQPGLAREPVAPGPVLENGRPRGLPLNGDGREKRNAGFRVSIDNDLLSYGQSDADYTAGFAVTLAGRRAASSPFSLDTAVGWLDPLVPATRRSHPPYRLHSLQVGLMAFTPDNLNTAAPIFDDRPYASLLFVSNGRTFVSDPMEPVYDTSFTVGLLGLDVAKLLQKGLHEALQLDEVPAGWDHQISDGGEPTLRFMWARQALLASDFQSDRREHEIKWRTEASVGYVTEAAISVSGRWGRINTPWWSFAPEHGDYVLQPSPVIGTAVRDDVRELYLWGGVKIRARAYNAFLQGQFRDSDVEIDGDAIERITAEAWIGVTWQPAPVLRLSYAARYQTAELERGPGSRDIRWAGFIVSRNF
ncbi:MAG TPA: lipid A deacylase LpxR family protein [Gammaproteobacteria bacterium]